MTLLDDALPVPRAADPAEVLCIASEALTRGVAVVLVTVVARAGSAPSTPGQKIVLAADGTCAGTVGGGALEGAILRECRTSLGIPETEPRTLTLKLGPELGMCCGGSVTVLVEPMAARWSVGIVGAGHIATALAPMLLRLGFAVWVTDEREAFALPTRFPGATVTCGPPAVLGSHCPRSGAVLVMTHDHGLDQDALEWALREGYAFVGGVGSQGKLARTRARLEAKGFPPEAVARMRMPLGMDIGARSPEEIAVSIAGEVITWRRGIALR